MANKKRKKLRRKNQGSIWRLVCVAIFIVAASSAYLSVGANCAGGGTSASISPQPQPGVVYFLDDHQGNTHLVTDSVGNIVHEESRYPYGVKRYDQNTADSSDAVSESKPYYSYTGKEYDEETGLVYFGGRYYAPELGRWITPDPLFLENDPARLTQAPKELNLYSYAINNPITYVDKIGEDVLNIATNVGYWIAGKPLGLSRSEYGEMSEFGIALHIIDYNVKSLLSSDNYKIAFYAAKGFADERYERSSGANYGAGLNVGYLGEGADLDDFKGRATEDVLAAFSYGISDIETETGKHGFSFSWTPAGLGGGSFTYDTETRIDIGSVTEVSDFFYDPDSLNSSLNTD
jgi:RHS repeat-associated protein